MEVSCPYSDCGKKFEWEPPAETAVFKWIMCDALTEKPAEKKPLKRYVITCPICKRKINVRV